MPQGYYTVEQWKRPSRGAPAQWVAVAQLPFGTSQTAAEKAVEGLGTPGFFRLIQMQRVIWAENVNGGGLKLRKSHASSPESLDEMRRMFERCHGKYPVEEVRAARRRAKNKEQSQPRRRVK